MPTTETAANPTEAAASTPEAVAVAATLLGDAAAATAEATPSTPEAAATPAEPAEATPAAVVEGAPEKYEFKAPEGKSYDANFLTAFEASAKEANLTQDVAQKMLEAMSPKIAERQTEQIAAINQGWLDSSRSDKEFGGDALEQNLGIAKKALDKFGSPELNKLLAQTGLGNHPEVIRTFYKMGQQIKEDTFVSGSAPAARSASVASVLYDNTKQ